MPKTTQLQIRVSVEEKARIQALAARAGMDVSKWVLSRLLPPSERAFHALCRALATLPEHRSTTLAEVHDLLARLPGPAFTEAVRHPPPQPLPAFEANYVAAMVEHAAAAKGEPAPGWVATIEPLDRPWFATELKGLRLHLLTRSPPAFRRRNLFVDSTIGDRV